MSIPGDNPVQSAHQDALGREPMARSFARRALALDRSDGLVVGVLGPWGSGKTTFVNFAKPELKAGSAAVLDFNPWMFSGADQLVESFFVELSAELKVRPGLEQLGEDLADYGETFAGLGWLPVVGPWIERGRGAAKMLGKYLIRRRQGSQGRRQKLTAALRKLDKPIIVILDDIDRLSTGEIRDVFRLIRLTASFPNVIYLVAFDRMRVEEALGEDGIPGRDYLEKILQVAVDLPAVPQDVLIRQITHALDDALADAEVRELDAEVWPDVLMEVIWPLMGNMRDVRRYVAAVHTSIDVVGSQIALADFLALEAIRIFLPDVYAALPVSVEGLCTPGDFGGSRYEPPALKQSVESLVAVAAEHGQRDVGRAMIIRLFPFARRHIENNNYGPDWEKTFLRQRRIGHKAVLSLYLERIAGSQLRSISYAEEAWARLADESGLEQFLATVPSEERESAIAALETFEEEFRPEHVLAATPVLLNHAEHLPDRPKGMFDMDSRMVVGRVAYRLLKSLEDPKEVAQAVETIMPRLHSLSAKMELLTLVGYRENAGHKLISEEDAKAFETQWREQVRRATAEALAKENQLVHVIYWARKDAAEAEPPLELPGDPGLTMAMLRSAKTETRGQTDDTRAVRRTPVFAWATLAELYGDEETLIARIEELRQSGVEIEDDLADLIDRYLDGWRPRNFLDAEE